MSFGRRLALFFVLIVLVPALALVVVLLAVSEDSRRGKADAQLAASVDTAFALYQERVAGADAAARQLARDPQLSTALNDLDRAPLEAFAQSAVRRPDVTAVDVDAVDGIPMAVAGADDAFAFTELALRQGGRQVGTLSTGLWIGFGVLYILLLVTLAGLYTRVAAEAVTDPLTGLWNRRRMSEALVREVDRAIRFDRQLSLVIFDVDDFKAINDTEGHPQGDAVLRKVADVVRERIRSIDVAARYGGDEIALILFETDFEGATTLAERLRTGVREADIRSRGGEAMQVTISVGVATLPDSAGDADSFVDAADRALMRAKRAGKDQIRSAPGRNVGDGRKAPPGEHGPGGRERRAAS